MSNKSSKSKDLKFFNKSVVDDYRNFPASVQDDGGYQMDLIQKGEKPFNFDPIPVIGPGAYELRLDDEQNEYRVLYVAKMDDAIWVLHAFQKTTRKISDKDISLAKARYKELLQIQAVNKKHEKRAKNTPAKK